MRDLKKLRYKSGLSLRELGKLAKVPYCNVRHYEQGVIHSHKNFLSYVLSLANALSLSAEEVIELLRKYSK